jgi:integral membrane sensor domain MASE1
MGIAAGNTLEAVAGAWLLRRAGFDVALVRLRDILALALLAAVLSTTLSATIGVLSLGLGGLHPWTAFRSLWTTWWLGDAIGALLVTPFIHLDLPAFVDRPLASHGRSGAGNAAAARYLPSGGYFARLSAHGESAATKLVIAP